MLYRGSPPLGGPVYLGSPVFLQGLDVSPAARKPGKSTNTGQRSPLSIPSSFSSFSINIAQHQRQRPPSLFLLFLSLPSFSSHSNTNARHPLPSSPLSLSIDLYLFLYPERRASKVSQSSEMLLRNSSIRVDGLGQVEF